MVSVDKYAQVRSVAAQGMGLNDLARTFHHSNRKIQEGARKVS
jgi:hypothetical protein